ncbi:FimB/Mfa2 family fimbrial subunit [Danxiaibacter flavus]|uniref:FimB/Mfa2 family fimbrial subunit n=1 Tax=Danxiaibacter flavus TaxID=3049108 RepID=A0ABV3ZMG5_9BACT|nr:FimB/Mfa2 family fimbrial subunit [Chitinophagaceae bacterium DXS]
MPVFSPTKMILSICLLTLGAACTKSINDVPPNNNAASPIESSASTKNFKVQFQIGNLEVLNGRHANKEMPLKDYLKHLYYAAFDSTGRRVSKIEQDSSINELGATLGVINDSLPAGKYTVMLIGTASWFATDNSDTTLASMYFKPLGGEAFFKKITITVGEADTAISNIRLERVTGELELRLTDTLSSEITWVSVIVNYLDQAYYVAADTLGQWGASSQGVPYSRDVNPLVSIKLSILGSDAKQQIVLHAYDKNGAKIYQKLIKDVVIKPNQKLILQGDLAAQDSTVAGQPVIFDPDYAGEPIIKNF